MPNPNCSGCNLTGYYKGDPCGAVAQCQTDDGKWWCHAHYSIAILQPDRFDRVREWYKRKNAGPAVDRNKDVNFVN